MRPVVFLFCCSCTGSVFMLVEVCEIFPKTDLWELCSSNSPAHHKTPATGAGQEQANVMGTSCSRQPQAALGAAILHLSLLLSHPPDITLELWLPQLRFLPTSHTTGRSLVDNARFYPKFVFFIQLSSYSLLTAFSYSILTVRSLWLLRTSADLLPFHCSSINTNFPGRSA